MKAQELFEKVTVEMIDAIEAGAGPWRMPWHTLAETGTPENVDGRPYRGMNALWLPLVATAEGWTEGVWATYRAWQRHGCQVRRGQRGTPVVVWKQTHTPTDDERDTDEPRRPRWFARGYSVFAAEQVEGADALLASRARRPSSGDAPERITEADAYFAALGATVNETGNRAFYSPVTDSITVPPLDRFTDAEHFYSTLAHEHVHWTGHPQRIGRHLSGRFGSDAYAAEELVAELGAAMWCAQTGIAPATRDDHAAYLAHWLTILRADARHLAHVATQAQTALDWMNTRAITGHPSTPEPHTAAAR